MDAAEHESPELSAALERLAAGDLSARDRIIELCSERLRRLAHRMLGRYPADLARRHAGPASYAANHGTNVMPRGAVDGTAAHYIDHSPAEDASLDRWTLFHEAIAALPEDEREVFHLVWYLGCDQKTIAGLMECSERTVKSRWRAAREAIRIALHDEAPRS